MDTRTVDARACWPGRRRRACHALFSPLAAALARGEHPGAAVPPRLPRAAGPPVGHEPAVVPADATGLRSSWDQCAEPRPAGWGLYRRREHLQYALSPARPGTLPAQFVAEPSVGH